MRASIRVALVGDFNAVVRAHQAIPKALELASRATGFEARPDWIGTETLDGDVEQRLAAYDAIWCVPASPYASMTGALNAIRFARESGRPFLGTCGGFQHALIEYARNVLGLKQAEHAESNPNATAQFISPLSCSLVERSGTIKLKPGSRLAQIYGKEEIAEEYHCSFGLNPRYQSVLENGEMDIVGWDENGEVRAVELTSHPFFIATLFQPERSALKGETHPLIAACLAAAAATANGVGSILPQRG